MGKDKRDFARIPVPMDIEVTATGTDSTLLMETVDISNSGAFIKTESEQIPEVGKELQLKIKSQLGGEEPPMVKAVVVRTTGEGFGVKFLDEEN